MKTLFFDLDGTLTDPAPGIVRCLQHALDRLGLPPRPPEVLTTFIGPPIQETFLHLADGDAAKAADGIRLYRQRYGEIGLVENALYPGIAEMLNALAQPGRRVFVATSKLETFAVRIVEHFGIIRHFERIFGSRLDGTYADKADLLAFALAETGTDPRDAIMIGDRRHDAIGAARNGVAPVGVLWGYGSREELAEAGVTTFCARPMDVVDLLGGR